MKRVVVVTYESGDIIPTQVAEGITDEEIYDLKSEIKELESQLDAVS